MRKVSAKCNKKITSPGGNSDLVEQTKSDYQVISQTEADLSEYKRSFNQKRLETEQPRKTNPSNIHRE